VARAQKFFLRSEKGTVAIEFAFIAPILILMFLGTIELCNALICRQKVTTLAASASDLVAQEDTISDAQLTDIFTVTNAIIYPYPTTGSRIIITSVKNDPNHAGQFVVDWSKASSGTGYTQGASITVPAGLITAGASVIMAQVTYTYTPPSNAVIHTAFTMSDTFYTRPRRGTFVIYSP
jgi:Flp pilus assembly protein TadG